MLKRKFSVENKLSFRFKLFLLLPNVQRVVMDLNCIWKYGDTIKKNYNTQEITDEKLIIHLIVKGQGPK